MKTKNLIFAILLVILLGIVQAATYKPDIEHIELIETELTLENWMLNLETVETELVLEDWMLETK